MKKPFNTMLLFKLYAIVSTKTFADTSPRYTRTNHNSGNTRLENLYFFVVL